MSERNEESVGLAALIPPKGTRLSLVVKGAAIGLAEAIPGVSGGTVALIMGIYRRLINAIKSFTPAAVGRLGRSLLDLKSAPSSFSDVARTMHLDFLLAVAVGMLPALLIGTKIFPALLISHRPIMHALFFGMILASCIVPYKMIKSPNLITWLLILLGAIAAFVLVGFSFHVEPTRPFTFVAGAVAICALVLPGVSGSYLLHALGQYSYISGALHALDIITVGIFLAGMTFGIVVFVRILSFLLERAETATLAVLTGLMLGSLRSVWFFQRPTGEFHVNSKGVKTPLFENIWPEAFDTSHIVVVGCVFVGIGVILAMLKADSVLRAPSAPSASTDERLSS